MNYKVIRVTLDIAVPDDGEFDSAKEYIRVRPEATCLGSKQQLMEIVPFYSTNSEQPEPAMTRIKPRDKSEYTLAEEWTDEEKQIIDALMIKKLTLREAEEVLNIPRSTIARKRDRILEKDGNLSQTF